MTYTVSITSSGQITLPKAVRELLGVKIGDKVEIDTVGDVVKVTTRKQSLLDTFAKIDEARERAEKRNPKIKELKKQYAGLEFEEVRDLYDKTPEGKKEFKEKYGIEI